MAIILPLRLKYPEFKTLALVSTVLGTWGLSALQTVFTFNHIGKTYRMVGLCYGSASVISMFVFQHLQNVNRNAYNGHVGHVRFKTKMSIRVRGIRILSKLNKIVAFRVVVSTIALYFSVIFFPSRCRLDISVIINQVHDTTFELIEGLLPIYIWKTEDIQTRLFLRKKTQIATIHNVWGQTLNINKKHGHQYFEQLQKQWDNVLTDSYRVRETYTKYK
ncbi:unnamed protein product [Bursaphelenchus okinawaensis]|uniref:Uncharacterized protein n=1 Tax=Bursaphelenchus okinawaensis TaxID=465554 RepID=A0A811KUY5_9BILA|nr:unnamed protein product [Bursaphelenchus okinawaensis]CAG9113707.1 unnamed protein product [Bursaphelenchus okinawaensis]